MIAYLPYLAVFSPLIAFLIAGLYGKQIGDRGAQVVTCFAMLVAAISSVLLFQQVILGSAPVILPVMDWITAGDFKVAWSLRVDQLAVVMMCVINIVSACVHIYSVGYMSHDPNKARFMAYLSLFTFAMLMLVTSDNLLQLFFGWEGVGVASYLLIGFWHHKHSANAAAMKAFIVNRVGDLGLALGVFATFVLFGSITYADIFAAAPEQAGAVFRFWGFEIHALTLVCLLLFIGAVGKSAQLGLHTWLPDAMEGPTPVSALIHAATMVTAGVFLVARFSPLFEYAPIALMVVCIVGALTAIVAATIGLTQFDIKRVIAYSTMSQLGYMFFALGVSAYGAAMFHLMTHAFFKALLFLGAGSVIHALHDEQDMRNMGGLWKKIPYTYAFMWIGSLALAGIPFFAGYYSKDMILEAAFADATWFGQMAYWIGITAAFLTAFYSWRLLLLTFHGKPRGDHHAHDHAHESPPIMLAPLTVLAVGAIFAGYVFYDGFVGGGHHAAPEASHVEAAAPTEEHSEEHAETRVVTVPPEAHGAAIANHHAALAPMDDHTAFWGDAIKVLPENDTLVAAHSVPTWVKLLPTIAGGLGILLAYVFYLWQTGLPAKVSAAFKPLHTLFFRKWFFDELYDAVFVKNSLRLGRAFWKGGDQATIDGYGPDGVASLSRKIGHALSSFQSGFLFQYAFIMVAGVIIVLLWLAFRGQMLGVGL
jgi:NADH-quinone oxidoreductase subunit L